MLVTIIIDYNVNILYKRYTLYFSLDAVKRLRDQIITLNFCVILLLILEIKVHIYLVEQQL